MGWVQGDYRSSQQSLDEITTGILEIILGSVAAYRISQYAPHWYEEKSDVSELAVDCTAYLFTDGLSRVFNRQFVPQFRGDIPHMKSQEFLYQHGHQLRLLC
jgi:hypothetical protein